MLKMSRLILTVIVSAVLSSGSSKEIPSFLNVCKISDPNYDSCVVDSIESLKPLLKDGIPSIRALPLDPLKIPAINFIGETFTSNMSDVVITNLYNFNVTNFDKDAENLTMHMTLKFSKVVLVSDFVMKGTIFILNVDGDGQCVLNFDEADMSVDLQGEKVMRNNATYFNVKDLQVSINPIHLSVWTNNLIKTSRELSASANQVINDNIDLYYTLAAPTLNQVAEHAINSTLSYVFSKWTYDELFPQ